MPLLASFTTAPPPITFFMCITAAVTDWATIRPSVLMREDVVSAMSGARIFYVYDLCFLRTTLGWLPFQFMTTEDMLSAHHPILTTTDRISITVVVVAVSKTSSARSLQ
jgi:hypothetical protein